MMDDEVIDETAFTATIKDNIWVPGIIENLNSAALDRPCGAICPWWFIIEASKKMVNEGKEINSDVMFRNQRIPLFQKVTDPKFTAKTVFLACQALVQ